MNRKEYLAALERALESLPEETRAAALDFYGEMIDDRMEDGMEERAAVAAMEAPEDIAVRLRAENPASGAEASAFGEEKRFSGQQNDAAAFSTLADQVLQSVTQSLEGIPELVDAGLEKAEKGLEEAARRMDQAAEKAEVRDQGDNWKTFVCAAGQVRSIALYAVNMPIRITPCSGDEVMLRYYSDPQRPYTLTLENGALTLQHPAQGPIWEDFSLEKLGSLFRFNWNRPGTIIRLEMPRDMLVDLLAHTTNGSVKAGGFTTLCQVDFKTCNSRVEAEDIVCKALTAESSNGRLVLRNVESKRGIRCTTSNSRIELGRVRAGEDMTLRTSNGRIILEAAAAQGALEARSSNGPITVDVTGAGRISLKTSNSRIAGVLPGRHTDWAIDSGTSNGYCSLPDSQAGERPLSVHTSNGSIDIRFREA